ncbi:MAG: hypothetical protein V1832_04345, partial [Nitrospirota bacterium]
MTSRRKIKIKQDEGQKRAHDLSIKRFALTYLVLMGIFFFVIGYTPLQKIIDVNGLYTKGVVVITSTVLKIMSIPSTCQGS